VALLLGVSASYITLQLREGWKREDDRQNWHRVALATEIGSWRLNLDKNELSWDDACFKLYKTDKNMWSGDYDSFLIQVHERDRDWVDAVCRKTIKENGYYRAVFRLANGDYIRAYGSVVHIGKEKWFAGVCIPATPEEYIGRPFVTQHVSHNE
jgi:PAS domain-containing protein